MPRTIPADTITFHYYNANPKSRKTGDCVIRAISLACDVSWDDALDQLVELAHKHKSMPNCKTVYEKYLAAHGYKKMKMPKKEDGSRYKSGEFAKVCKKLHRGKIVVISQAHHLTIAKDGKIWDSWNSTGRSVGVYWVKE